MLTDVSDANKSYTKLEVAEKSDLDLIAVKVLRKDCPDFLFPIKMMEIDGETEIRYELTDEVRFCYMPTQMKKREFIELLTNLIILDVHFQDQTRKEANDLLVRISL